MLAVPPALLDALRLREGAKVALAAQHGKLIVEPQPRPHYSLRELLARCDVKTRRTKQDREWLNGKRTGRELI